MESPGTRRISRSWEKGNRPSVSASAGAGSQTTVSHRRPQHSWRKYIIKLPIDDTWHGVAIRKGQEYRYAIRGEIILRSDFGDAKVGSKDVSAYIGTKQQLLEHLNRPAPWSPCTFKMWSTGSKGSGIAQRSGNIWFEISFGRAKFFDRYLLVDLELKE